MDSEGEGADGDTERERERKRQDAGVIQGLSIKGPQTLTM